MRDFTPAQAKQWAEQEAAKVAPGAEAARIAAAETSVASAVRRGSDKTRPNSFRSHSLLIGLLKAR